MNFSDKNFCKFFQFFFENTVNSFLREIFSQNFFAIFSPFEKLLEKIVLFGKCQILFIRFEVSEILEKDWEACYSKLM